MAAFGQDIDWMRNMDMGESKPEPKKKGIFKSLFSTSPEKKAAKAREKSRKQIAKNMRKKEKKRKKCREKGMRLSLNGKDCEPITPPGSPTALPNNRKSIGRDGMSAYLNELRQEDLRKKMEQFGVKTPPPSDDEWSDDGETTQAEIDAAQRALRRGGKRRRKRRRKTRRKKKRKSRRKSRKRKTKRRR